MSYHHIDIVHDSYQLGKQVLESRTVAARKKSGQFLTLPVVARYMANRLGKLPSEARLLDPGCGSAVLACAVIEKAVREGRPGKLQIVAYESDSELCQAARVALHHAAAWAGTQGIEVEATVHEEDFILAYAAQARPTLFTAVQPLSSYDTVIANPPYFKLRQDDARVQAMAGLVNGRTNIYTMFMALAIELLVERGQGCFIVPRSFCSGAYFAGFRRDLICKTLPTHVHLFNARDNVFSKDSVLQENVIFVFRKKDKADETAGTITISATEGVSGLEEDPPGRQVTFDNFLYKVRHVPYFRLPVSEFDEQLIDVIDSWHGSLEKYGLQISTGPVVPFRATSFLRDLNAVDRNEAVPLYWLHNVRPNQVIWPAGNGKKAQGIACCAEARSLLVPAGNYVLLRRFSPKEEPRRLTVALLSERDYPYAYVGLENHLNYIHRPGGKLHEEEALGLSALLGSPLLDHYFRIVGGHTQVNATELRGLPLPSFHTIREIGRAVTELAGTGEVQQINRIVHETLFNHEHLPRQMLTPLSKVT